VRWRCGEVVFHRVVPRGGRVLMCHGGGIVVWWWWKKVVVVIRGGGGEGGRWRRYVTV